jgi:DNA-binding NarL/FixJ family response regulator
MSKDTSEAQDSTEATSEGSSPEQTLTTRQKEILRLVAQGCTNREIGQRLDISVRTVEVHRFNLMRRLRVRNVAQLLRQAIALKIIPKGPSLTKV